MPEMANLEASRHSDQLLSVQVYRSSCLMISSELLCSGIGFGKARPIVAVGTVEISYKYLIEPMPERS